MIKIVVLLYFVNLSSEAIGRPLYGGDSVKISVNELINANIKLTEAKYLKEENEQLKSYIQVDSLIIKQYSDDCDACNKEVAKYKTSNKYYQGITIISLLTAIILLFK